MKFIRPIVTNDNKAIIQLRNNQQRFLVEFELIYNEDGIPSGCNFLKFDPTNKPLSVSEKIHTWNYYVKWGGYPVFKQWEVVPCNDCGRPYEYIATVECGWGDSGNCNIFISRASEYSTGKPWIQDVYVEASAC